MRLERRWRGVGHGNRLTVRELIAADRSVILVIEVNTRHHDLVLHVYSQDPAAAYAVVVTVITLRRVLGATHVHAAPLLPRWDGNVRGGTSIRQPLAVR